MCRCCQYDDYCKRLIVSVGPGTGGPAMEQGNVSRPAELLTVDGARVARGDLDLLCTPQLERWLQELDEQAVEVDLSEVTFFDSSALRVFLAARRRNRGLRIVRPSKAVERVLEITATKDYLVHGRDVIW